MVELRLLGPVEIWTANGPVPSGEPRRLAVLAALAVDADQVVPVGTLVDRVWGEYPPAQAVSSLRSYLTRLRRTLEQVPQDGEAISLLSQAGGYRLTATVEQVDLLRLRALVERARIEDDEQVRVELLRAARELWRGEPLGGMSGAWASRTREHLTEELLRATAAWAEAELAVGNVDAVLAPLSRLAAEHPLMEPLVEAQVRALVAAGRPTEALERCRAHRDQLAETYGTDQSDRLQTLYRTILCGENVALPARPSNREQPAAPGPTSTGPTSTGPTSTGPTSTEQGALGALDPAPSAPWIRRRLARAVPIGVGVCVAAALVTGMVQLGYPGGDARTPGTPATTSPPGAPDDAATIKDEFTGPLDLSRWGPYDGLQGNGVSHWAAHLNRVDGGELQLLTQGRNPRGHGNTSGSLCWCHPEAPMREYGVWKVRAKLDTGNGYGVVMGLWPENDEGPWITMAKVDDGERRSMYPEMTDPDLHTLTGPPVAGDYTQWHTYGTELRPTFFRFSLDDKVIFDSRQSPKGELGMPQGPMYLYLTMNSGPWNSIPGPDQSTPSTVATHVDWVSYHP